MRRNCAAVTLRVLRPHAARAQIATGMEDPITSSVRPRMTQHVTTLSVLQKFLRTIDSCLVIFVEEEAARMVMKVTAKILNNIR